MTTYILDRRGLPSYEPYPFKQRVHDGGFWPPKCKQAGCPYIALSEFHSGDYYAFCYSHRCAAQGCNSPRRSDLSICQFHEIERCIDPNSPQY